MSTPLYLWVVVVVMVYFNFFSCSAEPFTRQLLQSADTLYTSCQRQPWWNLGNTQVDNSEMAIII